MILHENQGLRAEDLTDAEQKYLLKRIRSHKPCNGTGSIGRDTKTNRGVACTCVRAAIRVITRRRMKPLAGLWPGQQYSLGRYVGVGENTLTGVKMHVFLSSLKDPKTEEPMELYVAIDDAKRIAELVAEVKQKIVVPA